MKKVAAFVLCQRAGAIRFHFEHASAASRVPGETRIEAEKAQQQEPAVASTSERGFAKISGVDL